MLRVSAVALAAALVRTASAAKCAPAWSGSTSYVAGDLVSHAEQVKSTEEEACTIGSSGCNSNGKKTVETTTTVTYNYVCTSGANALYCTHASYAPGGQGGSLAWRKDGTKCTVVQCVAAALEPFNASSTSTFAYPAAAGSTTLCYDADPADGSGDWTLSATGLKSSASGVVKLQTTCEASSGAPTSLSFTTNAAGASSASRTFTEQAGTYAGALTSKAVVYDGSTAVACGAFASASSVTAASAPVPDPWSGTGCPKNYVAGTDYEPGEVVTSAHTSGYNMVYKCTSAPNNLFCGAPGFHPGQDLDWDFAWDSLGSCTGSQAPTTSPVSTLPNLGGCPGAWVANGAYPAGARVGKDGLVYQCKGRPLGLHCPQAGYEPADSLGYWKSAWDVAGICNGTGPVLPGPGESVGPVIQGCPNAWSASPKYEAGDQVSFQVTGHATKQVYECKAHPYTPYCSMSAYTPGTQYTAEAWISKGVCSGSLPPTGAPIAYEGDDCHYMKAITGTPVKEPCSHGSSTDCKCTTTSQGAIVCERDREVITYTSTEIQPWKTTYDYAAGEVVRVTNKRFKCKPWPYYLWCTQEAYKPTLDAYGLWTNAWTSDGICQTRWPTSTPSQAPSDAPSISFMPSSTPSVHPSDQPSVSFEPSGSPSDVPSRVPSASPSDVPSRVPSASPSDAPSLTPSATPSDIPSASPSDVPSRVPSASPSDAPSLTPSATPSDVPSDSPSDEPSDIPSAQPSQSPT